MRREIADIRIAKSWQVQGEFEFGTEVGGLDSGAFQFGRPIGTGGSCIDSKASWGERSDTFDFRTGQGSAMAGDTQSPAG